MENYFMRLIYKVTKKYVMHEQNVLHSYITIIAFISYNTIFSFYMALIFAAPKNPFAYFIERILKLFC